MANYATQTDLEDRFGTDEVLRASDRDGSGVADPAAITSCLTAATGEIDSYVRVRYDLPLTAPPEHLEHLCCDIAMYRLSADSTALTEEKRVRYEDAIKWLVNLSKGIVNLGEVEDDEEVRDEPAVNDDITQDRLFTRTTMRGLL
jgi:phage gp36-like protein